MVEGSCDSTECPSQQTCHDLWGGVACYTHWVPFPFGWFRNNAKHALSFDKTIIIQLVCNDYLLNWWKNDWLTQSWSSSSRAAYSAVLSLLTSENIWHHPEKKYGYAQKLQPSWKHQITAQNIGKHLKIIWYESENNWGPIIVQFEEDFNSRTKKLRSGVGWGGYLRPDQFLDHLTVIKIPQRWHLCWVGDNIGWNSLNPYTDSPPWTGCFQAGLELLLYVTMVTLVTLVSGHSGHSHHHGHPGQSGHQSHFGHPGLI